MRKLKVMIIIIIVFFSFFLMTYFKKRNYSVSYKIDKYSVTEKYIKKDEKYYVEIDYNKNKYFYIINEKYSRKRKLVTNIKYYNDKIVSEKCLTINFNNKKQEPSCIKDNTYISKYLLSDNLKKQLKIKNKETKKTKSYENINVFDLNKKKVLVWNYHGFYYIDKNKRKNIKLFDKDIYDPNMIGSVNNYLVMPNYNEDYEFKSLKVLNVNNLKVTNIKLSDNISDESYIMGYNDKSLFIFDTKYQREYEIVPHKLKYRIVNPFIYNKGEKEEKTKLSLANNKDEFIYDTTYDYTVKSGKLYRTNKYNKFKVLVTDKEIKELVKKDNNEVYFISEDSLYVYSDKYNVKQIINYFELNFNYKNIIYIFD